MIDPIPQGGTASGRVEMSGGPTEYIFTGSFEATANDEHAKWLTAQRQTIEDMAGNVALLHLWALIIIGLLIYLVVR